MKVWPSWLTEVSAYWDSVRILVLPGTEDAAVWAWLRQAFGPLTADQSLEALVLDRSDRERVLTVTIEPTSEQPREVRTPRWRDRLVTADIGRALPAPTESLPEGLDICVFHSFKGGVGRTLHCVAVARRLSESGRRVLLVDGDLEAPGITWMVDARRACAWTSPMKTSWHWCMEASMTSTTRRSTSAPSSSRIKSWTGSSSCPRAVAKAF
ncbi:AAA family ATPase [Actinoplanes derwentensis]|uniref:AAA family ATPase n=1 Tax=Actinoplanes derwentensis TaxID=113562 RepID=UPI0035A24CCA